ncbi:hypothetical protein [Novosphingobium olei]|uniref:Uncharacterized protein n=1 Tax=Novosphingobium olei TaxID=2728851 RepID=A0A7Y0BTH5_9SPHN|nr:hypothetical protein [Novosphingobium olei]NML96312.1 hypothetical protein [Novosphingobium olei]
MKPVVKRGVFDDHYSSFIDSVCAKAKVARSVKIGYTVAGGEKYTMVAD